MKSVEDDSFISDLKFETWASRLNSMNIKYEPLGIVCRNPYNRVE